MSKFTPFVKWEVEYDGDVVKFKLRRLLNEHYILISTVLHPENGKAARGVGLNAQIVNEAEPVFRYAVQEMAGLKDADGNELKLDDILKEGYFHPLLDRLLGYLMKVSVVMEEDAKKSDAPQPATPSDASSVSNTLPGSSQSGG